MLIFLFFTFLTYFSLKVRGRRTLKPPPVVGVVIRDHQSLARSPRFSPYNLDYPERCTKPLKIQANV
ncbi:hypothetical protein ERO13_D07G226150v2 [Gossypium hirsutum]|uniref:Secreted protein n=3 Tax=Gossypium TaxID=3633 RepID=A0A5D2UF47_GOSMU|nr:hypothetical protein ERO13_D07G226150v2 [Gossypium hirsutum]TYG62882.1 hypothetical protein ES288_D07G268300v1 [Gossypium darwinii]TYH64416.1 hypothetical protein ES332_D07G266200v1 [Gossypium tomentosum]TYI75160.1 hypothetical protein E1A91_D07G256100v1 [Gossypium mustelinum]